jgi:hypothetical protein
MPDFSCPFSKQAIYARTTVDLFNIVVKKNTLYTFCGQDIDSSRLQYSSKGEPVRRVLFVYATVVDVNNCRKANLLRRRHNFKRNKLSGGTA